MIFFLIALGALCVYRIKIYQGDEFCHEYMSRDNTLSIKGIFVILIVASHFKQYVVLDSVYDKVYLTFAGFLSQSIVVMFLFYSGYGIYESIKRKGQAYVKTMPYKRVLISWVNLALALFCYMVSNYILGIQYDIKTTALAFTGYTTIGNSNWYIFAILIFYIITWLSFTLFSKKHILALMVLTFLTGVYVLILRDIYPDQGWWYNTALCYPGGGMVLLLP